MKALVLAALVVAETYGNALMCSCMRCRSAGCRAARMALRGGSALAGL